MLWTKRAWPDGDLAWRLSLALQYRPSAKVLALLEFLDATRNKDRKIKTVVFSQWTTMLNIIEAREQYARRICAGEGG